MTRTAFIKPKDRVSPQGRHLHTTSDGKPLGTSKAPGAAFTFSVLVDRKTRQLNTGFNEMVLNLWTTDESLPNSWKGSGIHKEKMISKQTYFEIKYDKPKGFFTSMPATDPKEYSYLQTFKYRLYDQINRLDLEDMNQELMYELARASVLIANSLEEAQMSPYARFYISHVDESEERLATKKRIVRDSVTKLNTILTKSSPETALKLASILRLVKGQVSRDTVETVLDDYINDAKHQLENISKFEEVAKLLDSATGKLQFEATYLLRSLVDWNVIRESKGRFTWPSKYGTSLETIGRTETEAIKFIMDKDNEAYATELKEELKAKMI